MNSILLGFSFFMILFMSIGLSASRFQQSTVSDYLLGSKTIGPFLNALSAASTNCSGFMFIGLIGLSYSQGIYAFWFAIGIILGSFCIWYGILPTLKKQFDTQQSLTYIDVILPLPTNNNASSKPTPRWDRILAGLITLLFLSVYAAAQLKAGSKATAHLFNWDISYGIIISALIILVYCFSGGYRATVWSDAAQSFVMMGAMGLLLGVSLYQLGGFSSLITELENQSPRLTQLFPTDQSIWTTFVFGLGWVLIGIGSVAQPHIMIRPLSIPSIQDLPSTRRVFYTYYILFTLMSISVGICARALLPMDLTAFDPEVALPSLADEHLPAILVGVILAGIFASSISTADSQILTCSTVLGKDLKVNRSNNVTIQKIITILVIVFISIIALQAMDSVFNLVILSWSLLAAVFVPIVLFAVTTIRLSSFYRLLWMLISLTLFLIGKYQWIHVPIHPLILAWLPSVGMVLYKKKFSRKAITEP